MTMSISITHNSLRVYVRVIDKWLQRCELVYEGKKNYCVVKYSLKSANAFQFQFLEITSGLRVRSGLFLQAHRIETGSGELNELEPSGALNLKKVRERK